MQAPLPAQEKDRLRMLELYRVLDTAGEEAFDQITRLGALICEVPICLISLVGEERLWFKSKVGLEVPGLSRDIAFCAHAILQEEVLTVEDATQDRRFRENPLVTGSAHFRFYAGAPLTLAPGIALGTFCVIDRRPRQLAPHQMETLTILRQMVLAQLELRRASGDLQLLNRVVPMCSWCRSVRDAEGRWQPLTDYVEANLSVTHGICPSCSGALSSQAAPGGAGVSPRTP